MILRQPFTCLKTGERLIFYDLLYEVLTKLYYDDILKVQSRVVCVIPVLFPVLSVVRTGSCRMNEKIFLRYTVRIPLL